MLSKNLPFAKKLWIMPARNFLDAVSAWKGLLSGDGGYFIAVLRAEIAFIKWWLFHKNKSVFPASKKATLTGYLNRNIAWLHFARKKKHFDEIVRKST